MRLATWPAAAGAAAILAAGRRSAADVAHFSFGAAKSQRFPPLFFSSVLRSQQGEIDKNAVFYSILSIKSRICLTDFEKNRDFVKKAGKQGQKCKLMGENLTKSLIFA